MDSWTDELQFETSTPLTSINTHMKATQHPHAQRTPAWPRTLPTPLRNETLLPGSRHASAGARQSGSYTRTLRHRYAPRKGRAGPTTSPAVGSPLEAPRGPYGWDQDQALCCPKLLLLRDGGESRGSHRLVVHLPSEVVGFPTPAPSQAIGRLIGQPVGFDPPTKSSPCCDGPPRF